MFGMKLLRDVKSERVPQFPAHGAERVKVRLPRRDGHIDAGQDEVVTGILDHAVVARFVKVRENMSPYEFSRLRCCLRFLFFCVSADFFSFSA